MSKHRGFRIIAMIFIVAGIISLVAFAVMLLWNWLIPSIFAGGPTITYWQALGLMILSKILFGGFKPHHPPPFMRSKKEYWKSKIREKWNCMDDEKKSKIKDHMFSRSNVAEQEEGTEKEE